MVLSEASQSQKGRYRATPRVGGPGRSRDPRDGSGGAGLGEGEGVPPRSSLGREDCFVLKALRGRSAGREC